MKTVQCPLCRENIYSEAFRVGEKFPCPSCRNELTVEPYTDAPIVKTAQDFMEKMAWAQSLWKDGRLLLNRDRLQALGEFLVGTLELESWGSETLEQLDGRLERLKATASQLDRSDRLSEVVFLNLTLLDIFRKLRENAPPD